MRVLITGGAGFIGRPLTAALLAAGHEVVVVDSLHPQVHHAPGRPAGLAEEATFLPLDVSDPTQMSRALVVAGLPDAIVHLAAETGTGQSLTEASRHGSVNVLGTTVLLDALSRVEHRPGRIVLTSSRAVYGEGCWRSLDDGTIFYPGPRTAEQLAAGRWDPETPQGGPAVAIPHDLSSTWPRPTNVYAATKLAQEHVLGSWCAAFGVDLDVLRLQNVFGPGQAVGNSYTGVLTFFARRLAAGEPIEVYEDGDIVRDFVYVGDVVDAIATALAAPAGTSCAADIGSGRATTLYDVARWMTEGTGAPAPVIVERYRLGDVRAASANIDTARRQLGWAPRTDLRDGLARMTEWVAREVQDVPSER